MKDYYTSFKLNDIQYGIYLEICDIDNEVEMFTTIHAFTDKAEELNRLDFPNIDEALDYCKKKYSVTHEMWGERPVFQKEVKYKFQHPFYGPGMPTVLQNSKAQLRVSFTESTPETEDWPKQKHKIDIMGTKEGLKYLAYRLLECADSESFDEFYHEHYCESDSNLELTLHGPKYFEVSEDTVNGDTTLIIESDT